MYGLPQAGLLAQKLLEKRLGLHRYTQSKYTPGFWSHETRPISFSLVVDDFGVKYVGKEHADHLIAVLKEHYEITEDWEGTKYCGITFDWDYENREVHMSMPGYVRKALVRFQHPVPEKPEHQPYESAKPAYGAKVQYAKEVLDSPKLNKEDKKYVQQVIGVFLFYGRAVDGTMLCPLSAIAMDQANPTQETLKKVKKFLNYAATHPDAIITYRKSDMILAGDSDASYLSKRGARSRAGGHFFMSSDTPIPPNNGAVLTIAQLIQAVMSSAAEAEIGALFINAREAVPARKTLQEMGHSQGRTPIQTDNTTALGVVNSNIQPRKTKAMDMRWHWLRCRDSQGQFRYFWRPGPTNKGDYWTKHHCATHHQNERPTFLTPAEIVQALRARQNKKPHVF